VRIWAHWCPKESGPAEKGTPRDGLDEQLKGLGDAVVGPLVERIGAGLDCHPESLANFCRVTGVQPVTILRRGLAEPKGLVPAGPSRRAWCGLPSSGRWAS